MVKDYLMAQCNSLRDEQKRIHNQLRRYPATKLSISHQGHLAKWYATNPGEPREYIPKKRRSYAEKLATKKYLELREKDLLMQISKLDELIMTVAGAKADKLLLDPAYRELITTPSISNSQVIQKWREEEYTRSTLYPEKLTRKSLSGNVLRSKAEMDIDVLLFQRNIPYRYECELVLKNGAIKYPDFTIMHPISGKIFYWEHFGRMDDTKYVRDNINKVMDYIDNGIIPGINLICTFETSNIPLSIDTAEKMIELYFG